MHANIFVHESPFCNHCGARSLSPSTGWSSRDFKNVENVLQFLLEKEVTGLQCLTFQPDWLHRLPGTSFEWPLVLHCLCTAASDTNFAVCLSCPLCPAASSGHDRVLCELQTEPLLPSFSENVPTPSLLKQLNIIHS